MWESLHPIIYATSDIHSPRYLGIFRHAVSLADKRACIVVLAGDLIDKGRVAFLDPVVKAVQSTFRDAVVLGVFGNEEYHEVRSVIKDRYPDIMWLEDSYVKVKCNEDSIAVIGTTGALDRPTRWQRRNMPWLENVYKERPRRIAELIKEARSSSRRVILASHYALTRATLKGENPRIWPELYSTAMEKVIKAEKPDAAIHGHAHNGVRMALVDGVPVFNVALPLNRQLVEVKFRRGITSFF